ncbi:hypothetical protein DFA_11727 [Cavenderia fasciculata]|uniref:PH domain-containing protein n=1 Tax=Cavenderia fasciculata TaxID=261658 RepID=F4QE19_CACFS|nr:uncharacterized protein DFA_11727 [Cavenderia fasciculata]EGG13966.1 hypothetical protein DFA_11727 [Cavenderia fasciculata]|eukprot:XP_004350674.1 hypothetical protein DFA_11727 [Cavenderia fasciculata]
MEYPHQHQNGGGDLTASMDLGGDKAYMLEQKIRELTERMENDRQRQLHIEQENQQLKKRLDDLERSRDLSQSSTAAVATSAAPSAVASSSSSSSSAPSSSSGNNKQIEETISRFEEQVMQLKVVLTKRHPSSSTPPLPSSSTSTSATSPSLPGQALADSQRYLPVLKSKVDEFEQKFSSIKNILLDISTISQQPLPNSTISNNNNNNNINNSLTNSVNNNSINHPPPHVVVVVDNEDEKEKDEEEEKQQLEEKEKEEIIVQKVKQQEEEEEEEEKESRQPENVNEPQITETIQQQQQSSTTQPNVQIKEKEEKEEEKENDPKEIIIIDGKENVNLVNVIVNVTEDDQSQSQSHSHSQQQQQQQQQPEEEKQTLVILKKESDILPKSNTVTSFEEISVSLPNPPSTIPILIKTNSSGNVNSNSTNDLASLASSTTTLSSTTTTTTSSSQPKEGFPLNLSSSPSKTVTTPVEITYMKVVSLNDPIIKEGYLKKKGGGEGGRRNWTTRWCRLKQDGTLSYFKKTKDTKAKGEIKLHQAKVETHSGKPFGIVLMSGVSCKGLMRDYLLMAESKKEQDEWITAINDVIKKIAIGSPTNTTVLTSSTSSISRR